MLNVPGMVTKLPCSAVENIKKYNDNIELKKKTDPWDRIEYISTLFPNFNHIIPVKNIPN